MSRPLTPAEADVLSVLRERRLTPSTIARKMNISASSVRAYLELPTRGPADLTPEEEAEIRDMWAAGKTRNAICERFRIGKSRAAKICDGVRSGGVPRKPRKRSNRHKLKVVQVPSWVPDRLSDFYLNVAERDGEEAAASACRALKNGKSVHAGSRLPATVSPAGC